MNEPLPERALQRLLAMAAAADDPPTPPPSLPPRYRIVRELGRGGMGVVYEVIDQQLGRRCALKTLGNGADDDLRRRFAREAAAAARLRHPHIAVVHDATPDYITMQLIDGGPIDAPPGLDRRLAVELVRDAARALQHAHEQGIVHRDLKPSNLLVEGRHVYVVDFGLARSIGTTHSVSLDGAVLGTPAFMPPEQALGQQQRIDARSDVYGLGATLHHCLTGRPPFRQTDLPALLRAVVEDDPRPATGDRDLDLVLGKCLEKEPERRYASAAAFAEDLERWLRDEPVVARRPSWLHRWRKRLRRQRMLWRVAAAAMVLTALVLAPIALREHAARSAASEAIELADHVATVFQDATLAQALGDGATARQHLQAGIVSVREFLQRHEVPRVRYLLARLLRASSQPDEALTELERALAGAPDLADARFERGLLLAARAERTPAQQALAIADLGAEVRDRSVVRDVDRLFGRAEQLRLRGDHAGAMELLREVIEYDGLHVPARLSLAAAARARGDQDLAVYYAASACDLQQGYAPFYLARERRALSTSILGLEGCLVDFHDVLQDAPDNAMGLAQRGIAQLRRAVRLDGEGRVPAAIEAARAAVADHDGVLALHPDLPGALNNRAVCRLVLDRLSIRAGDTAGAALNRRAAADDLAQALALVPMLAAAHANAGHLALRKAGVLRALGRLDDARRAAGDAAAAFQRAIERAPADWAQRGGCERQRAVAAALVRDETAEPVPGQADHEQVR
ncbi:MAG: protein kinase [Planctomycetes bacterium]|nr:protein kinase [Planctomycetota bacterium]